ncbi:MAG: sensor histidine kinase [Nostocoides sp.]
MVDIVAAHFALFPQLWALTRRATAITVSVGVVLAAMALHMVNAPGGGEPAAMIWGTALITVTLSLALGLLITRLVQEAASRAAMIDELHQAQALLAAAEHDPGVLAERGRPSREIHDTLAQGFTSVLSLTRAAMADLGRDEPGTAQSRLQLVESVAMDNLREARVMVAELSPDHLRSRGLVEALERLCDSMVMHAGVPTELVLHGEPEQLKGQHEVLLLRCAQEGLSNIRRHAQAGSATVDLVYADAKVCLILTDDGVGPGKVGERRLAFGRYGLDGLCARAEELGGAVALGTGPGGGSRLTMELPR